MQKSIVTADMLFSPKPSEMSGDAQSALRQAMSSILSSLLINPPYLSDDLKSAEVKRRHEILNLTPEDPEDYLVTDCYPSSHVSTPLKTLEQLHLLMTQVEQDNTLLSDGNASALISNVRYRCPEPDHIMLAIDLGVHRGVSKPLLTLLLRLEGSPDTQANYKYANLLPCDVGPKDWHDNLEEARSHKPSAQGVPNAEKDDKSNTQNATSRSRAYSEAISTKTIASYNTARQSGDGSREPSQDTMYLGHNSRKGLDVGEMVDEIPSDDDGNLDHQGDYFNNPSDFWAGTTSDEDGISRKPQLDDYQDESESEDTRRKREEVEERDYWNRYNQSDSDSKTGKGFSANNRYADRGGQSRNLQDSDDDQKKNGGEWYMQRYSPVTESVSGQTMYDVPANMSLGDLERHHRERDMNRYANARHKVRQALQSKNSSESGHSGDGRSSHMSNANGDRIIGESADSDMRQMRDPIDDLSLAERDLVLAARRQAKLDDSTTPKKADLETLRRLIDSGEKMSPIARLSVGNDPMGQASGKGKTHGLGHSPFREEQGEKATPQGTQYTGQTRATETNIRPNETFLPSAESEASMMVMGTTYGEPDSFRTGMRSRSGGTKSVKNQTARDSQQSQSKRGSDAQDNGMHQETYNMVYDHLQNQRQQASLARERNQQKSESNCSFHQDDTADSEGDDDDDGNVSAHRSYGGSATPRTHRSVDVAASPVRHSRRAGSDRTQHSTISSKSNTHAPSRRPHRSRASRSDERALDDTAPREAESRTSSRHGSASGKSSRNKGSRRVTSHPKLRSPQQQRVASEQWRSEAEHQPSASESEGKELPGMASRRRNESVKSILKGAWQLLDESQAPIAERSNEEEFMRLAREAMRECISSKRSAPSTATSARSGSRR